jgi:branched-chain amino acid transport system permease protein
MSRRKMAKPLGYSALLILLLLMPLLMRGSYYLHTFIMAGIYIILACSLRLIATTGQLSLAHGGMMAVGAYVSTILVMKLGFSTWVALPLAGLAAMSIALLVGSPFGKLKGIYFAMGTLFLGELIRLVIEGWAGLTGGKWGVLNVPHPDPIIIPGLINIDFASSTHFYYFILILVLITLLILYAIEHSRIGITFAAIQQADILAEAVGMNVARLKVIAFGIGCFFAGIAGAFYSHYLTALNPAAFGFLPTIYIVIYMIFGGIQKFYGPIIGVLILTFIPELASGLKEYQPFLLAAVLMLVIFWLPEGLVGLPHRLRELARKRFSHA